MIESIQAATAQGSALPILVLAALALLIPLARRKIYPHTPTVIVFAAPTLAAFFAAFREEYAIAAFALDAVVFGLLLIDFFSLPRTGDFTATRTTTRVASQRRGQNVELRIANVAQRPYRIWIRDDVPQEFDASPEEFAVVLEGRSQVLVNYEFRANKRGSFLLEKVYIRVRSRWAMWNRYVEVPEQTLVHVYPDLKQLGQYAVLARTNRLSLMGVRRTRKIGQDNEFERLRDYTQDDNYRHIEWRATARRRKLTVKDYQANQSQRVIFLVDCGRMMTNEASGVSLLDHSLNAMLMLSYVALQRGDAVGMLCFSNQVKTYVPARGGMRQMNQLLHAAHDQFPDVVESRYDDAFFHLSKYCKKRSLVVLVSNLIDEVNSNQLHEYLSVLVGRHLPLGVLLRDHRMFDAADNPRARQSPEALYQACAAAEILTWRHQVLVDLHHAGVLALDVFPEDMTAPMINKYLEIKARHLL